MCFLLNKLLIFSVKFSRQLENSHVSNRKAVHALWSQHFGMHGYSSSRNDEQDWHCAGINVKKRLFCGDVVFFPSPTPELLHVLVVIVFPAAPHKLLLTLRLDCSRLVKNT